MKDTPHPNEVVKYCPICKCRTWTDVNGKCEWADAHGAQKEWETREAFTRDAGR